MPSISHRIRLLSVATLATVCTTLSGSPAHADSAPAQAESTLPPRECAAHKVEYPFDTWGDNAPYVLVPGGDFEPGAPAWDTTGAAGARSGNGPRSSGDRSLALPAGTSATSPEMCIGLAYPTLRFFAAKAAPSESRLAVTVHFRTPDGTPRQLKIAELDAGDSFAPTRRMLLFVNLLSLHPQWDRKVSFRLAPTGGSGEWRVDDVFVDPYER